MHFSQSFVEASSESPEKVRMQNVCVNVCVCACVRAVGQSCVAKQECQRMKHTNRMMDFVSLGCDA